MTFDENFKWHPTKPCLQVDEGRFFKENLEFIKNHGKYKPGNSEDEHMIIRLAKLDSIVIQLLFETGYYDNRFHFWDFPFIVQKLQQFLPNMNITDEEVQDALSRCVAQNRLYTKDFDNGVNKHVIKWKYNSQYLQLSGCREKNPFECEEFITLLDEIDKL